jgi:hypothetical protein
MNGNDVVGVLIMDKSGEVVACMDPQPLFECHN